MQKLALSFLAASLLTCALSSSCGSEPHSTPPPPGPVTLSGEAHMREFLSDARFTALRDDPDWWTFHSDGTYEAHWDGGEIAGTWIATTDTLTITLRGDEDRTLPLRWLDGKLNIEIDGKQYRRPFYRPS